MLSKSFDDNQLFYKAYNLLINATARRILFDTNFNGTIIWETYSMVDNNSRLVMSHAGNIQYFSGSTTQSQWVKNWEEPKDACSFYKVCGPFSMCTGRNHSVCSCLPGFEPDDKTGGCKRTIKNCHGSNKDIFINKTMISMDDPTLPFQEANSESECIERCIDDCGCLAYSFSPENPESGSDGRRVNTQGCWFWNTEPNNLKGEGTHNISFRVPNSSNGTSPRTATSSTDNFTCVFHFTSSVHTLCFLVNFHV